MLILIWMASLAPLATCLLSSIYYFEKGDVGFGMIVGYTVLVNCTGDVTAVFFYSILETLAGLIYVGEVAIFFWTGPFVANVLFKV